MIDRLLLWFTGRSSDWSRVRAEHLAKEPRCMACGTAIDLQVHHIKPFHVYPHLELVPDNLITLCNSPHRECHFRFGHAFNWSNFCPNVRGDVGVERRRVIRVGAAS